MTTTLGIITNYKNDNIKSGEDILNPININLEKYFGLATNDKPVQQDKNTNITVGNDKAKFLRNNFVNQFITFDKLSNDTPGGVNNRLPNPWDGFVKNKLIIIHLTANKTNGSWNTSTNDTQRENNRIYIFDEFGNELRERAPESRPDALSQESKFYTIIIEKNKLYLLKNKKIVKFTGELEAMTLARLISDLLGDEIEYNDQGKAPDRGLTEGRKITTRFLRGGKSKRKQRKGGKKSMKKQNKSMRKMKRSSSKK